MSLSTMHDCLICDLQGKEADREETLEVIQQHIVEVGEAFMEFKCHERKECRDRFAEMMQAIIVRLSGKIYDLESAAGNADNLKIQCEELHSQKLEIENELDSLKRQIHDLKNVAAAENEKSDDRKTNPVADDLDMFISKDVFENEMKIIRKEISKVAQACVTRNNFTRQMMRTELDEIKRILGVSASSEVQDLSVSRGRNEEGDQSKVIQVSQVPFASGNYNRSTVEWEALKNLSQKRIEADYKTQERTDKKISSVVREAGFSKAISDLATSSLKK